VFISQRQHIITSVLFFYHLLYSRDLIIVFFSIALSLLRKSVYLLLFIYYTFYYEHRR